MSEIVDAFIHKYGRLPTEFDKDYLEMLNMSKYKITSTPHYKPSKCANCGGTKEDGRKYVDFGLEVDWYGIVYLCSLCIKEIATQLGLMLELEEKVASLKRSLSLEILNKEGNLELFNRFVSVFEEVKTYLANVSPTSVDSNSTVSDSVGTDKATETESTVFTSAAGSQGSELQTTKPQSRTAKPFAGPGSKNVSSLADLLNLD